MPCGDGVTLWWSILFFVTTGRFRGLAETSPSPRHPGCRRGRSRIAGARMASIWRVRATSARHDGRRRDPEASMAARSREEFDAHWREIAPRLRRTLARLRVTACDRDDLIQETALRLYQA